MTVGLFVVFALLAISSFSRGAPHHRRGLLTRITRNAVDQNILEILRPELIPEPVTQLQHDDAGQCIFVKSEQGLYSYTSPGGNNEVCGFYVIADPNQFVEFEFEHFGLEESCTEGGLLSVVDGWELNGQFFPGTNDHPKPRNERYQEFCEKKPETVLQMSQNVGLLEFRIPRAGEGFRVRVRFVENPKPCNAVLQKPEGIYTLRNYGERINCTISIIFPESFRILASSVGAGEGTAASSRNLVETGLIRQCRENGDTDYVEIRGGDGLDPDSMDIADNFCGIDSKPERHNLDVLCGNTAVRLISSGLYVNSVTVQFEMLLDFKAPALTCPAFLEAL